MPLNINDSRRDDVCIVTLSGDFDMESSGKMKEFGEELVRSGTNRAVINLSGLNTMDTTAVKCLHDWYLFIEESPGQGFLRLVVDNDRFLNVIRILKVLDHFEVYESAEDALSAQNRITQ